MKETFCKLILMNDRFVKVSHPNFMLEIYGMNIIDFEVRTYVAM